MTKQELLFAQIKRQQEAGERLPIVSLEEFFEGNDDYGSIGCNLDDPHATPPLPVPYWPHPSPEGFYEILRAVRERQEVQDVLVEVSDTNVGEEDWPFSELVYILTTASIEEIEAWVIGLHPTEVSEGYEGKKPALVPDLLPGYTVCTLWWD